jgi:hypothetical protein
MTQDKKNYYQENKEILKARAKLDYSLHKERYKRKRNWYRSVRRNDPPERIEYFLQYYMQELENDPSKVFKVKIDNKKEYLDIRKLTARQCYSRWQSATLRKASPHTIQKWRDAYDSAKSREDEIHRKEMDQEFYESQMNPAPMDENERAKRVEKSKTAGDKYRNMSLDYANREKRT